MAWNLGLSPSTDTDTFPVVVRRFQKNNQKWPLSPYIANNNYPLGNEIPPGMLIEGDAQQ